MGDYVSPDEVPVIGPDPYDHEKKHKAIEYAESKLEADVNDGHPIQDPDDIHEYAANAYASYILAAGPMDPADAFSGDFADAGDEIGEFANQLRSMYQSARSAILSSEGDESEGSPTIDFGGSR